MIIEFHKGIKWNLPQIPQYEGYTYSPMLCCPECEKKGWYNWMEETRLDIVGYAEVNGELQVCCECHHCGAKYRYHLSKHWNEDASFNVERWQDDVALQLFLNRETYRKFELEEIDILPRLKHVQFLGTNVIALPHNGTPKGFILKRELTTKECRHLLKNILYIEINTLEDCYDAEEYKEYNQELTAVVNQWIKGDIDDCAIMEFAGDCADEPIGMFNLIPIIVYLKKKGVI